MTYIGKYDNIEDNYKALCLAVKSQLDDEIDVIANFANISAFVMAFMDGINWAGFYILKENELVLGPFQGKPACVRIPFGKGVCGNAAKENVVICVKNVHEYEGHIACDSDTNSEIVLPIYKNGNVYGVFDIDSPKFERFGSLEQKYLQEIAEFISNFLDKIKEKL